MTEVPAWFTDRLVERGLEPGTYPYVTALRFYTGDVNPKALSHLGEVLEDEGLSLEDLYQIGNALFQASSDARQFGELDTATRLMLLATSCFDRSREPSEAADTLAMHGMLLHENGDHAAARKVLVSAHQRYRRLHDPKETAKTDYLLASVSRAREENNAARLYLARAHRYHEDVGAIEQLAHDDQLFGDLLRDADEAAGSFAYYDAALSGYTAVDAQDSVAETLTKRALASYELDRFDDAIADLRRARAITDDLDDLRERGRIDYVLAEVFRSAGDLPSAREHWASARDALVLFGLDGLADACSERLTETE